MISVVDKEDVLEQYVKKSTDGVFKYPRTEHMKNLGGATADDHGAGNDTKKALDKAKTFLGQAELATENVVLTIQEKIDGANLGIYSDDEGIVRFKGRGHHVTTETMA